MNSLYVNTYKRIDTIPGLGPLTSAMLCFEIGDFNRFSSGKKLLSLLQEN
jgi:transposase